VETARSVRGPGKSAQVIVNLFFYVASPPWQRRMPARLASGVGGWLPMGGFATRLGARQRKRPGVKFLDSRHRRNCMNISISQ
jgi:hypothetical protein